MEDTSNVFWVNNNNRKQLLKKIAFAENGKLLDSIYLLLLLNYFLMLVVI